MGMAVELGGAGECNVLDRVTAERRAVHPLTV